jgi:hypothetical protein
MATSNAVSQTDLPEWYQQYTQNLGTQAMNIAQGNNAQPLPAQSVAGFNSDQTAAFDQLRAGQGVWQQPLQQAQQLSGQIAPTAAKFVDYAQGAVGAPAMTTSNAIQPWAQGAQDAVSGNAQGWTDNVSKYMSPYTTQVVDNIARLGKRNWEDSIMPGVNSSMIGSGQFGSTRNADILGRAGVNAANDITGQQSNALQAGYTGAAGIFANDANRAQQQGQMQSSAALAGGNMMQGALSADANRVQNQGQLQANTALSGATASLNALNTASDNIGALGQSYQTMANTDTQGLLNIGNQQQQLQQGGLTTAYNNAMLARTDPWTQLSNATGVINGVQLPKSIYESGSDTSVTAPNTLQGIGSGLLTAGSILN